MPAPPAALRVDARRVDAAVWRLLLEQLGPSLALWRAAEVAVLRGVAAGLPRPVLDVGCGDGLVTSLALPRMDVALDPDPAGLAKASARGSYRLAVVGLAEHCPLQAGSVGTIISNSVFEHLERLDDALAGLARVLRPGGRMIITTPTESFGSWLALPSARYAAARNRRLIHLNLLTATEWRDRLARAGLRLQHVQPYLRRRLVLAWDALDQVESVWIARRRVVGVLWKRLPPASLDRLARLAAPIDLSSGARGGGRLIVACKE